MGCPTELHDAGRDAFPTILVSACETWIQRRELRGEPQPRFPIMKYPHTQRIAFLAIGALVGAGLNSALAQSAHPTVITPPAINDGSNSSRAPFPASRQFDDVKAP